MKKTVTQFIGTWMTTFALFFAGQAYAETFTAVSSGAWSSSAVWANGDAPGTTLGLFDQVIINSGVSVTLDQDVSFDLGSSMQVDGTLMSGSNTNMLTVVLANISGSGNITLNRLKFGTGGTMTFAGVANIDNMWTSAASLQLASQFNLNDSLFLDGGTLNLNSGSSFTLLTGAVIRVDDGIFTSTAGVMNNGNEYSVRYVGSDKNIGLELAGSAISDIYVDLDDNNSSLSITGNSVWSGDVHHNTGMIDLNGGSLTLMGDYTANAGAMFSGSNSSDLIINSSSSLTSDIMFDPSNNDLNDLTINVSGSNNAEFGNDLTINGTLLLESGNMSQTGGSLTLAADSEINVENGDMILSGGTLNATNNYSVVYTGSSSSNSGIELSGSGLNNLAIDLENEEDSIAVMQDLSLDGELDLSSGGLGMEGHSLVLNGSLSTSSEAWISGDENSDFTFNTSSLVNDTLWFNPSNNHVGTITVNADDNSDLMIGNDVMVENMILSSGGVQIWDNSLWLETTGTITGTSEDRYVIIDGEGELALNVQVSAPYIVYPVGTTSGYSPVSIQQNTGTAGYFMVGTNDGVWSMGISGDNYASAQSIVDRTWNIESESSENFDINVMAMWSEDMEVNNFDRDDAYMMQFAGNNSWDFASQTGTASTPVGEMFSMERENVTSPGQFAIADRNVTLKINENTELISSVYPNPVKTVLTCEIALDQNTTAQVIDPTGKVIMTHDIAATGSPVNYTIDFTNYTDGVYFVNFTNAKGAASYRVVKN